MTEEEKQKIYAKWGPIISNFNSGDTKHKWLAEYAENQSEWTNNQTVSSTNNFESLLPIAMRISATTLAGGGTYKSKPQQLREDRLNKLRKIDGQEPNIVLEDNVIVEGLVSVQPLSAPTGNLFYMDYKYETKSRKGIFKYIVEKITKLKWTILKFLKKK